VAKRARQLMEDPEKLDDRKPVSTAVDELFNDKLEVVLAEEQAK
ncbi:MAG: DNA-directed RNA polymerase subunit omega, partial [Clostridia bacterium]|nr:DNA-directed RNA polymerase subunit omega [Clostridia bacterium]